MAAILGRGLETNPDLVSRMRFVVEHRTAWTLAWLSWHAAALSILWYFLCFARAHETETASPSTGVHFVVLLTAAGIVPDLIAESIEIGVLPELAANALNSRPSDLSEDSYLTIHRIAIVFTGYLANGLYTLATVIATWSTRKVYPTWVWLCGLMVGLFGFALSYSALINSVVGMFWSNVGLVPSILVWQVGVAIHASTRAASEP